MSVQKTDRNGMAAIIMFGVVCIICILASAAVVIAFFLNAPW